MWGCRSLPCERAAACLATTLRAACLRSCAARQLTRVRGAQHGNGTMVYADSSVYKGDWVDGKRSGEGTFKCAWPTAHYAPCATVFVIRGHSRPPLADLGGSYNMEGTLPSRNRGP